MNQFLKAVSNPAQIDSTEAVSSGVAGTSAEAKVQVCDIFDRVAERATQADIDRACAMLGFSEEETLAATVLGTTIKAFLTGKDAHFFQYTGEGISRLTKRKMVEAIKAAGDLTPRAGDAFVFRNKSKTDVMIGIWGITGFSLDMTVPYPKLRYRGPTIPKGSEKSVGKITNNCGRSKVIFPAM